MGNCLSSHQNCCSMPETMSHLQYKKKILIQELRLKSQEARNENTIEYYKNKCALLKEENQTLRNELENQPKENIDFAFENNLSALSTLKASYEEELEAMRTNYEETIENLNQREKTLENQILETKKNQKLGKILLYLEKAWKNDIELILEKWRIPNTEEYFMEDTHELVSIEAEEKFDLTDEEVSFSIEIESDPKLSVDSPIRTDYLAIDDEFKLAEEEIQFALKLIESTKTSTEENPILKAFSFYTREGEIKPLAIQSLMRTFNDIMDKKYECDCMDLSAGRPLRTMPDFVIEFLQETYGLKSLANKTLCQLVYTLEKLWKEKHIYATIICRLFQIFDENPISEPLAVFLTRARYEFNSYEPKKKKASQKSLKKGKSNQNPLNEKKLNLIYVINMIYSFFETDRFSRGVAIRLLRPENLSVEDYLFLRVCHKLTRMGEKPETLFNRIDIDCGGSLDISEMIEGIKSTLELSMPDEDIETLFSILDPHNSGEITKEAFLNYFNINLFYEKSHDKDNEISLSTFLLVLVETYQVIRVHDTAFVQSLLKDLPLTLSYQEARTALKRVEPFMLDIDVTNYYERCKENGLVMKKELIKLIMEEALGGKGLREFEVYPPIDERRIDARIELKRSSSRTRDSSSMGSKLLPQKPHHPRTRSGSRIPSYKEMSNRVMPIFPKFPSEKYKDIPSTEGFLEDLDGSSSIESPDLLYLSFTARRRGRILTEPVRSSKVKQILENSKIKLRGVLLFKDIQSIHQRYGITRKVLETKTNFYSEFIPKIFENFTSSFSSQRLAPTFLKKSVLHPDSNFKSCWNIVVLLLLMYVFIVTPWLIAFEDVEIGDPIFFIETIVDIFFLTDIMITLNTAFYDQNNNLETNRHKIFLNYLSGSLIIDVLAVIPLYLLSNFNGPTTHSNSLIRFLRISKVSKIFRASKVMTIIKYISESEKIEDSFLNRMISEGGGLQRLCFIIFITLIMAHMTACMWYFTAKLDNFSEDTWVVRYGFIDASNNRKYLAGLYWAFTILTTVGFGDIYAYTETEMALCIIWMFFGVSFYSLLLGSISSILSSLDSQQVEMKEKVKELENFGFEYSIPEGLIKKMKKIVKKVGNNWHMDEKKRFYVIRLLPRKLRYEVAMAMFNRAPAKIVFFSKQDSNFIVNIVPRLEYSLLDKSQIVYKRNDHPDYIYFLVSGRVNYVFSKENFVFKEICNGAYFGEIEIVKKCPRLFTVISKVPCEFLTMGRNVFERIVNNYPRVAEEIISLAEERYVRNNKNLQEFVDLLDDLKLKRLPMIDIAGKQPEKSSTGVNNKAIYHRRSQSLGFREVEKIEEEINPEKSCEIEEVLEYLGEITEIVEKLMLNK